MSVVLQLSDPHFGTERPVAMAALQALCAQLRPDLLLATGDITQRARRTEFARARAFFDGLGVPAQLVLPGNHDIPLFDLFTRAVRPHARYLQAFGPALEGEFSNDELLVLTLNTTRRYRHSRGAVSAAQIERVAQRVAAASPRQLRLVAVHQPVAVTLAADARHLLRGHEAAIRCWAAAGVDAVLGGHIHLPYVLPLQACWPELARPVWAVQAGTALSHRLRGGLSNSVNVIHVGGGATVERWDLDEAAGCFRSVGRTVIR